MSITHNLKYYIYYITLLSLVKHAVLVEETEYSTENNEIIPRDAIQKLDYSVRQALLRAIDKLEQEAELVKSAESNGSESFSTTERTNVNTKSEDVRPTVKFFTAVLDESNAEEELLSSFIENSKKWQKTMAINDSEKADNKLHIANPSVQTNEIFREGSNEIQFEIRKSSTTSTTTLAPTTTKRKPKTTTTTTTTTPRPTHNEDGENIEIVEQQDIRIQEAPLVSAFTVDLDESGVTKKVVPIVHVSNIPKTVVPNNVVPTATQPKSTIPLSSPPVALPLISIPTVSSIVTEKNIAQQRVQQMLPSKEVDTSFNSKIAKDTNINDFLIERQKRLEQEIYELKLQAQQQQELILRQLKLLEEQTKLEKADVKSSQSPAFLSLQPIQQPQINAIQLHQQPQQPQQQQQQKADFNFDIRPSVEYSPNTIKTTVTTLSANNLINNNQKTQQLSLRDSKYPFNTNYQSQSQPQHLSVANAFPHNNLPISNLPAAATQSSVQIQPATQLNITPLLNNNNLPQQLPQYSYQTFQTQPSQLVPSYVTNAIQQQRARLFRQNIDTGNFGQKEQQQNIFPNSHQQLQANQQQQQFTENQNFYRQHLDPKLSNYLQQNAEYYQQHQLQQQQQPASGHSLSNFAPNHLFFNNNRF